LDELIKFKNLESSIQVALAKGFHGLLSLPYLPIRMTNGRVPLVDYSQIFML
jgi:hypothetical protein